MPQPCQIAIESRHARLFELIRQRNVAEARRHCSLPAESANFAESRLFILRAEQSLHADPSVQARP